MKKWTKNEEDYLRNNTSQSTKEIGKHLGRSSDSIRKKRRRLGLIEKQTISRKTISSDIKLLKANQKARENAKKLRILQQEVIKAQKERDAFLKVGKVDTYSIKSKSFGKSQATVIAVASDWHSEEQVLLSQTNGLNEYNQEIFKLRAQKFFAVLIGLIKVHQKEYDIDTMILALLGDFISGSIHEDLMESNNIQPTQALWEVQKVIASGIKFLLKETNLKFVIPCSSGNHGRMTAKQRVSTDFGNSLEIFMYRQLKEFFKDEKRINFIINNSYLTYLDVYDYTLRFHHGHFIKYGGGVGGIFIPAFKAIAQWNKMKRADYDFFGHFHQMKSGGSFFSNGSLIGFNPYAVSIKADYEKPSQSFMILAKNRGIDVIRRITL